MNNFPFFSDMINSLRHYHEHFYGFLRELDFLYKIVDSTSNFSNTSTSCFNWTISVEQQEHDHHFCFVSIDCLSLNSSSIRQIPKRLPRFITELPLLFGIRFITQFEDSSISLEYNSFSIELHGYVL